MFCGAGLGPPIVRGAASWRAAALVLGAITTTLESGWGRADTHLVLPNGLPTRVVPTYPEPGLPTFTYPQQNVIDTGDVTGATAATGTGASDLTFGGTGSGVQGAIVATGYSDLLGQNVGSGECVALVQATSGVGLTGTWVPGDQVEGNTNLAPGTAIATFGSDGTYTNTYGQSHAAIYLGQDQTGIYVEDQWLGHAASTLVIPWTTSNSYESGSKFYVITHG